MTPKTNEESIKMEILTKKVHEWLKNDGDSMFFDSLACANYVQQNIQEAYKRGFGDGISQRNENAKAPTPITNEDNLK